MHENGLLLIRSSAVERLLPVRECIAAMENAFVELSKGRAVQPVRHVLSLPDGSGALYSMPGRVGEGSEGAFAVKLVTLFPGNAGLGLEAHQGVIVLLSALDGRPVAVIEAGSVTAIRTAAVSALATRLLAVADATDLAILGSGVQAISHLEAMLIVRPLQRVRVWSRTPEHAIRFAREMSARHAIAVNAVASPELAVRGAHIVCTVTGAREPILRESWVEPGTHINAVGSSTPDTRELDSATVARARVFVDSREAALAEAGDILIPVDEGVIALDHIQAELADLVTNGRPGRLSPTDVTVFKSLGLAIEDVAAARAVHARALADGMVGVAFD